MPPKLKISLRRLPKLRIGKIPLLALGGFLIAILGAFYLVVVNVSATKGFTLKVLEREKESLTGANERLAVEAARLKSLSVIDQNASSSVEITLPENSPGPQGNLETQKVSLAPRLVPVEKLEYLPLPPGPVASRSR